MDTTLAAVSVSRFTKAYINGRPGASLRPRHPLRLGNLGGRHLGGHLIAIFDCHLAKVGVCCGRRSQVEPHVGQRIVLRHTKAAVLVRHAEVELCVVKSLVGGLSLPRVGLGVVSQHALADVVHFTEAELRAGIPLIGQLTP